MRYGLDRVGRQIPVERAIRGCFDKKTFESRNKARDWSKRKQKKFPDTATEAYKCHVCGMWHLTSLNKKNQRIARAKDWKEVRSV